MTEVCACLFGKITLEPSIVSWVICIQTLASEDIPSFPVRRHGSGGCVPDDKGPCARVLCWGGPSSRGTLLCVCCVLPSRLSEGGSSFWFEPLGAWRLEGGVGHTWGPLEPRSCCHQEEIDQGDEADWKTEVRMQWWWRPSGESGGSPWTSPAVLPELLQNAARIMGVGRHLVPTCRRWWKLRRLHAHRSDQWCFRKDRGLCTGSPISCGVEEALGAACCIADVAECLASFAWKIGKQPSRRSKHSQECQEQERRRESATIHSWQGGWTEAASTSWSRCLDMFLMLLFWFFDIQHPFVQRWKSRKPSPKWIVFSTLGSRRVFQCK